MAGQSTKVYARVRRLMPWEEQKLGCSWNEEGSTIRNFGGQGGDDSIYSFAKVLGPKCNNDKVFRAVGVPILNNVSFGYNSILITYGQTGSGKTFTMSGKPNLHVEGLLEKSLNWLLDREDIKDVKLSAVEAFGHHVAKVGLYDLLKEENQTSDWSKKVGDPTFDVSGLVQVDVKSKEEATKILNNAHLASHFAPTNKNPESSRGHIAYVINCTLNTGDLVQKCHVLLVDLAGSDGETALKGDFAEKVNTATLTARRLEAGCINTGLSQLQVIFGELASRGELSKSVGIGLRRILHPFISTKTFISVLFCISPSFGNRKTTESTLKFASRACQIKTKPVPVEKQKNYQKIVSDLKDLLKKKDKHHEELEEHLETLENDLSQKTTEFEMFKEMVAGAYKNVTRQRESNHKYFRDAGCMEYIQPLLGPHQVGVEKDDKEKEKMKNMLEQRRMTIQALSGEIMMSIQKMDVVEEEDEVDLTEIMADSKDVDEELSKLNKALQDEENANQDERNISQVFKDQMLGVNDTQNGTDKDEVSEFEDMEAMKDRIHQLQMELDYQKRVNHELSTSHGQVIAHLVRERPKATSANKNKRSYFFAG